jgi:hypothetical protein
MRESVRLAAGSACLAAVVAFGAVPADAASLAVRAAPKGVRGAAGSTADICTGDCGSPRYYYRAYRPYYSQYYWRPHYRNIIVSDQPFHAQPVPWWATGTSRRYAIGPAVGY